MGTVKINRKISEVAIQRMKKAYGSILPRIKSLISRAYVKIIWGFDMLSTFSSRWSKLKISQLKITLTWVGWTTPLIFLQLFDVKELEQVQRIQFDGTYNDSLDFQVNDTQFSIFLWWAKFKWKMRQFIGNIIFCCVFFPSSWSRFIIFFLPPLFLSWDSINSMCKFRTKFEILFPRRVYWRKMRQPFGILPSDIMTTRTPTRKYFVIFILFTQPHFEMGDERSVSYENLEYSTMITDPAKRRLMKNVVQLNNCLESKQVWSDKNDSNSSKKFHMNSIAYKIDSPTLNWNTSCVSFELNWHSPFRNNFL